MRRKDPSPRLGPKHWLLSDHTGLAQESVGVALAAATAFLRGVKNDIHGKENRQRGLGGYQSHYNQWEETLEEAGILKRGRFSRLLCLPSIPVRLLFYYFGW